MAMGSYMQLGARVSSSILITIAGRNFLQQSVMVENSKDDDLMPKPLPRHFKCLVHCAFPLLDLTFLFACSFSSLLLR